MDFPPSHDLEYLQIGVILAGIVAFFIFGFVCKTRRAWLFGTLMSWIPIAGYYWVVAGNLRN